MNTEPANYVPFDAKNSCTLAGLEHWTKHAFEHLGWMVLASSRNDDVSKEKVSLYKKEIAKLLEQLEKKEKEVISVDSKNDLKVLIHKVTVLKEHADKDFAQLGGGKKKSKGKSRSRSRSRSKKGKKMAW